MKSFTKYYKWFAVCFFIGFLSIQAVEAQPEYRKRRKQEREEKKNNPVTPAPRPQAPPPRPKPEEPNTPAPPPTPTYYIISGKVIDFDTRQPKEGVVINVVGKGVSARTDRNGNFQIRLQQNQNVQLSASLYRYKGKTVNAVPGDDDLIIALRKESALTEVVEGKEIETSTAPVLTAGDIDFSSLLDVKTSTASKSAEKISDAPGVISTITQEEIERMGANTLADVLQRASSVFITSSSLFTQNAVSIRGDLSTHINNHVLILLDGRPVREGIFGGLDMAILASFPLKEIQQIEVIRGPGSVLYGTNAYAGVINIITKSAGENTEIRGTIGGGTYGAMNASVSGGGNIDSLQLHAGAQFYKDDGWNFNSNDEPRAGTGLSLNSSIPYGRTNIGARIGGKYKDFTFNTLYTHTTYTGMGSAPNWSVYPKGDKIQSNRFFADMGYTHSFSDNLRLDVNATINSFNANFKLPGAPPPTFREYALDLLVEPTLHYHAWRKRFNWIVGGVIWNLNGQAKTGNIVTIPEFSDVWTSGYTQLSIQPIRAIKLIGGMQVNKATNQNVNLTPRIGLILNPLPGLGFKVLYGEAFRAAFRGETSINTPVLRGGANLNAERIGTFDIQAFYDLKKVQFSATYFRSQQRDLITRRPTQEAPNITTYFNSDRLLSNGGEVELKATPIRALLVSASFIYQENIHKISTPTGEQEIRDYSTMPNLMYKISAIYNFKRYASLGVFYQYAGATNNVASYDVFRNSFGTIRNVNPEAKPFHFVTANLNLNLFRIFQVPSEQNLSLQFFVYNLLDEKAYIPEYNRRIINTIPFLQSRTFYANLTYQF